MVFLLLQIVESAEMSIIQITMSKVGSLLTNRKLHTRAVCITCCVTRILSILLVCQTLYPVGIVRVTHCILSQKFDIIVLTGTIFCVIYCVAVNSCVIIFVLKVSVSTFAQCLIWEPIPCSCVHIPAGASCFALASFVEGHGFVESAGFELGVVFSQLKSSDSP